MSEVLANEKWDFNKNRKVKVAELKRYKGTYQAGISFSDSDRYLRSLRNSTQSPTILQFNTPHTSRKNAICLSQIAFFYLTKNLNFRPQVANKYFDILAKSVGCRSPPSVSDFEKFTNQKRRKSKCRRTKHTHCLSIRSESQ